jgi:O-antigen/teichoic acid export membrane protein
MTPDTLGSRIRRGLAWKAGSQVTLQISRVVVALVLARLLTPHDWGLAAMVVAFSSFVVVFTDNALGTALVQRRQLTEGDRSTVFWVNVGIGLVLTLSALALAGPLARFYGEPDVEPLFAVFSVIFLIRSLGTTQAALLTREMEFRNLEIPAMAASLVGAVAGITIALADYGAWAIIGQQVTEAVIWTALLWRLSPWRPSLTFSTASIRRLGAFAGNVFGENVVAQAHGALSSLLIGRVLGPTSLGIYTLGTSVIMMPFTRIAAPLQQVFFPAFSRVREDRERLADMWIRVSRLVGLISIPSLVGLVVVAPDFVEVVLGPQWSRATPVIQILAWVGLVVSLQTLNGEVLLALDRAGTLFRFTTFAVAVSLGALVLGLNWGIVGVATSVLVASLLVEFLRAQITTRALGIPIWRFFRAFVGIAQAAAAMAAIVLMSRMALIALEVPATLRLAVLVVVGGLVYCPICFWRDPDLVEEVKSAFGRRRRHAIASTTPAEAGP